MRTSHLFDEVMSLLGAGVREINPNAEYTPETKAVAAYIKNHRVSQSNMFEMIEIMWPNSKMRLRPESEHEDFGSYLNEEAQQDSLVVFDVTFEDGSGVIITSARGLSIGYDVIS